MVAGRGGSVLAEVLSGLNCERHACLASESIHPPRAQGDEALRGTRRVRR